VLRKCYVKRAENQSGQNLIYNKRENTLELVRAVGNKKDIICVQCVWGFYQKVIYLRPVLHSLNKRMNTITVPPAPRRGYTMYYDRDIQQWVFVKKTTS
jgi:hypothetical protein